MDRRIETLEKTQSFTLQQSLEAFYLRCKAKNLSGETLLWYRKRLGKLQAFLESRGVTLIREVSPNLLRAHLESLREAGAASGTIFRTYGAMRCYFGFLSRERMMPASPMTLVEKPRREKRLIDALTLEQAQALLAQPDLKTFGGLRIWSIMVLVLDTGLRLSEVLGLRRDQVDFQANVLRVIGKGNKEREVPFGSTAKNALWQYLARVGDIPGQDLAFVNQFGQRIQGQWVEWQVRVCGRKAGIQGVRVSPHTLRHTMATQYVLNGGDPFSLQKILGHSTLDMVRIYVGLAQRDVVLQHKKFSPMDRMGIVPGLRRQVRLK